MNILAHLYLSGNDENIVCGNFIGDSVKGIAYKNFPASVQKGILLHRHIDAFTDNNPLVKHSKSLLFPKYRHFSAVIVDIFYDYFLANHWSSFSSEPLEEFNQRHVQLLAQNKHWFPSPSAQFFEYMVRYDLLNNYRHTETIARVLKGMSRRTSFDSNMGGAVEELTAFHEQFTADFTAFFSELVAEVEKQKIS